MILSKCSCGYDSHSEHLPKFSDWQVYFEEYVANNYLSLAELVTELGYAVPEQALQYLSNEEIDALDNLTKPVKTDHKRLFKMLKDSKFKKTHLAKAISDNLNDMPTDPQIKVADIPINKTKFSDLIYDYLDSKTEAKKERSQRLKACQRVIEFCGDLPLADYTKLHAYDLAKAMDGSGYSNAQINKMIT